LLRPSAFGTTFSFDLPGSTTIAVKKLNIAFEGWEFMEWKEGFTAVGIVVSALLIIAGWFVSQWVARSHERFRSRLAKTEEMSQALINCRLSDFEIISASGNMSKEEHAAWKIQSDARWQKLSTLVQVYGNSSQRKAIDKVLRSTSPEEIQAAMSELERLLVDSIRAGFGIK
jgi:hypothetical protein